MTGRSRGVFARGARIFFRLTFQLAGRFILSSRVIMTSASLRIGEVAARAGVNPKTLRFYESMGLLPAPSREGNGYRRYSAETVEILSFVKQAQGLGFTLAEIKEILSIRRRGEVPCVHVRSLLQAKAAELDQKLADLVALRGRIRRSLAAWGRSPRMRATVCPHIEAPQGTSRRRQPGRA